MSVDLSITLKDISDKAKKYLHESDLNERVHQEFPLLEIRSGKLLFDGVSKGTIDVYDNEIYFSAGSNFYDYIEYAAYAVAKILDLDTIFDSSSDENLKLEDLKDKINKLPARLEADKNKPGYPMIVRLMPKSGNFRLNEIEKAVDKTKEEFNENVSGLSNTSGLHFSLLDKEKNIITNFMVEESLTYIECEYPLTKTDFFDKVINKLSIFLNATILRM